MSKGLRRQAWILLTATAFLFVLAAALVVNLANTTRIQRDSEAIYQNRLRSLDYLVEADRDLYQSHLFLLQYLTSMDREAPNPDLLTNVTLNAGQAWSRINLFRRLFEKYPGTARSDRALSSIDRDYRAWEDELRRLEIGVRPGTAIGAYLSGTYQERFLAVRDSLDELTEELLTLSEEQFRRVQGLTEISRSIATGIVCAAFVFAGVLVWVSVLLFRSQRKIADQEAELLENEKRSLLHELITRFSHMLNTPLGNLLTVTSHLQTNLDTLTLSTLQESVDLISRNVKSINGVLSNIRAVGGEARQLHLEPVTIDRVFSQLHLMTSKIPVKLRCENRTGQRTFRVDIFLLAEILNKFVDNTGKFAAEKGMSVTADYKGGKIVFKIENGGPAIPTELVGRIFRPFENSVGVQSPGLGLFVAENLTRHLLHGTLKLAKNESHCVRFECRFPAEEVS